MGWGRLNFKNPKNPGLTFAWTKRPIFMGYFGPILGLVVQARLIWGFGVFSKLKSSDFNFDSG